MNKTSLPITVDPATYDKFNACIHCGLCLPACPTYVENANEADSPRGRIHLMKAAVDGVIAPSQVVLGHLDQCLVCRACETACPSGVVYHDLIEAVRPQVAQARRTDRTCRARYWDGSSAIFSHFHHEPVPRFFRFASPKNWALVVWSKKWRRCCRNLWARLPQCCRPAL